MRYLIIVCLGAIINHSCNAYEYLYNQDDSDLRWLNDDQLYGYRDSKFNGDFDDYGYVPKSYRKSLHYPPIVSYHPRTFYVDTSAQLNQWDDDLPLYLTYATLPRIEKKPIYFGPPTNEPPPTNEYYYPPPETKYLPPSKQPIAFTQPKNPNVFTKVVSASKNVYLPPTRIPATVTPMTTTTTTTVKPSTPKSLYLPPIVIEPTIGSEYLPLPPVLFHLQPPPVSVAKPILFNELND